MSSDNPDNQGVVKSEVSVWVSKPVISRKEVEFITKKASRLTKFKLLFRRSHYSVDGKALIRYKKMGDTIYVMKRGTRL